MNYPAWMYRNNADPTIGFQCTQAGSAEVAAELVADGWSDDPNAHGVAVVKYPAELIGGVVKHVPHKHACVDANGNYPYGPAPTVEGFNTATVGR